MRASVRDATVGFAKGRDGFNDRINLLIGSQISGTTRNNNKI